MFRRLLIPRASRLAAATGLLLACAGCQREQQAVPEPQRPDVVILQVNGLRAYGAGEAALEEGMGHSPWLRFTTAHVQSVGTYVSQTSMATGFYPSAIPICGLPIVNDASGRAVPSVPIWCTPLPPGRPTVSQVLALHGYHTALFTAFPYPEIEQAEATYETSGRTTTDSAEAVEVMVAQAGSWWHQAADAPRLMTFTTDVMLHRGWPAVEQFVGKGEAAALQLRTEGMNSAARDAGRVLGGLIELLRPQDSPRDLVVFVTSAYGMDLGETPLDNKEGRGNPPPNHHNIFDRTAHVPLWVMASDRLTLGRPSISVNHPVELLDISATIYGLTGITAPAGLQGTSLVDQAIQAPQDPVAYTEFGDMLSLRTARNLFTVRFANHGGTSLDPYLTEKMQRMGPHAKGAYGVYDMVNDPIQAHNLHGKDPQLDAELFGALYSVRTGPAAPVGGLAQEQVEALRKSGALSYW